MWRGSFGCKRAPLLSVLRVSKAANIVEHLAPHRQRATSDDDPHTHSITSRHTRTFFSVTRELGFLLKRTPQSLCSSPTRLSPSSSKRKLACPRWTQLTSRCSDVDRNGVDASWHQHVSHDLLRACLESSITPHETTHHSIRRQHRHAGTSLVSDVLIIDHALALSSLACCHSLAHRHPRTQTPSRSDVLSTSNHS